MKKVIYICNTYFQLMTAIQMKNTFHKNDYMSVLLSDHSQNAEKVANNLTKLNYFDHVFFINTKSLDKDKHRLIKAFEDIIFAVFGNLKKITIDNETYDELYFYNIGISTATLFSYLRLKNDSLKCHRFEEGILSYNDTFNDVYSKELPLRMKLVYFIRKMFGEKNIFECIENYYCFYPEYYKGSLIPVKIPFITNNVRNIITKAFNIDVSELIYKQKYIYFASVGDFEGEKPVGEVKLAQEIAALVGFENLLVKVHPRDNTNLFAKAGLNVDKGSDIPWEVIQFNYDFRNHVFLTAFSGSVLFANMMLKERPKTYFLYQFCDISDNKVVQHSVNAIEKLFQVPDKAMLNRIYLAEDLKDIL